MARSKKTSLSQKAVSVGTIGMPKPLRKILTGRIIAFLIVLIIPILFATGLVSVTWKSGIPKLSINQQKASEIKETASQKIQELRDKSSPSQPAATDPLRTISDQAGTQFGTATDRKPDGSVYQKSAGLIKEISGRLK